MDFLIKHKLINSSQHGFLKSKSCLTNLLCFFEEITKWVDEGSPVDIIYLDFQKAFDKVPHQRLILKLKSHGIGISGRFFGIRFVADGTFWIFHHSSIHNSVNIIGRTFMLHLHGSCHICVSMCDQHLFVNNFNERYNERWYSPGGVSAVVVIRFGNFTSSTLQITNFVGYG